MVALSILSTISPNQGSRFFPFRGCLGLTPINVDGVVRTKLESDSKPLPGTSITVSVRCYEYVLGRVGVQSSNVLVDHTQVLWLKPDEQAYADVGDMDLPFHISLPTEVGGFSMVSFVEYRCLWRIEAVINHLPIFGVGVRQLKHYDLPLIRHSLPPRPPPPLPSSHLLSNPDSLISPIRCCVRVPPSDVGPLDLVSIGLQFSTNDSVAPKLASLVIERRLLLSDSPRRIAQSSPPNPSSHSIPTSAPPSRSRITSPSPLNPPRPSDSSSTPSSDLLSPLSGSTPSSWSSSSISLLSSDSATSSAPLLPQTSPLADDYSRCIVTPIVTAESSERFTRDSDGSWVNTLTVQWPAAKSNSRWAIGETLHSGMASVIFIVRGKVVFSSPSGSGTFDLPEQEISVVSMNDSQRQLGLSKYNESLFSSGSASRSQSKSPRGSRRERQSDGPLPRSDGARSSTSRPLSKISSSPASLRRPHTSAGPRDKKHHGFSAERNAMDDRAARRITMDATNVSNLGSDRHRQSVSRAKPPDDGGSWRAIQAQDLANRRGDSPLTEIVSNPLHIQAWEEELRRIEQESRRSSRQILGAFSKKDRGAREDQKPMFAKVRGLLS